MKLRIKFSKYGAMKFIGHLDMMRYFQKAIRRADIDISYSIGFSPHQIMSFAAPLGVGLCSMGEYFDIEVNSAKSSKQVMDALNGVMVDGVYILDVRKLPDKAENAMASVAAAGYMIEFKEGKEPEFDWKVLIPKFISLPHIMATKKTKKSEVEIDLKPSIYELTCRDHGIYMMVDASSKGNIKPKLVMDAFYKENGALLGDYDLQITRQDTYGDRTGNFNLKPDAQVSDEHDFIPLGDFGDIF